MSGQEQEKTSRTCNSSTPKEDIVPTISQERQPFINFPRPALTVYESTSNSPSISPPLPNLPSHSVGSSVTRNSGWKRVKQAIQSKDLFITRIPNKGEAPGSRRKWTDLESTFEFSLRECLILFLALLAIGIFAYSFLFEHWTVLDSIYFTTVLLTTVGYGDITPSNPGGKLFASFFALVGVAVLGLALGVVGSRLVEAEIAYAEIVKSKTANTLEAAFARRFYLRRGRKEQINHDTGSLEHPLTRINSTNSIGSDSASTLSDDSSLGSLTSLKDAHNIHMLHRKEFRKCNLWLSVVRRQLPSFVLTLVAGALIMSLLEHWKWQDSIYYCVITATTIGFGDLSPQTKEGKWCAMLLVPLIVAGMGYRLGNFATFIVEQRRAEYNKKLWSIELTAEDIEALDEDHDGAITELDYIKFMLVAMKKCDGKLFDQLREQFGELDMTHNGKITNRDLKLMVTKKMKKVRNKLKLSAYKQQLLHNGRKQKTFGDTAYETDARSKV